MAYPCALCKKVGHPQAQCPEKPPGAKPCSDCRRVVGHAPKCKIRKPGGKGTASNGGTPHRGPRAPKPAVAQPTSAGNGVPSLSDARVRLVEKIDALRLDLAGHERALRVLDELGRAPAPVS